MPIPNLQNEVPINQYTASNGQTEFSFTFYIFATSDIKVYVNDVLKTIATDYVVKKSDGGAIGSSDLPLDGGKIIFNVGLNSGNKVSLNRDIPVERSTQFTTGGGFFADNLNTELTRILAIQQQITRDIGRSFRLAPSDAEGGSLQLPTNRADNILAFDASGNLILYKLADIDKASVSPYIATLLNDVNASEARTTLDAQQLNSNLTALSGLTGASNKIPMFTGAGAGAMTLTDKINPATTTGQGIVYLPSDILISNNAGTPNTKIDLSAGNMIFDDGSGSINSPTILTGDLANLIGTSDGMLDTGTKGNTADYSVFAIYNPTTNVIKPLASLSRTAPTLPAGFTKKEYRGKILTDASGNILPFKQYKDRFEISGALPFKAFPANSTSFVDINFATNYAKDVEQIVNCFLYATITSGISSYLYVRAKGYTGDGQLLTVGETNSASVVLKVGMMFNVVSDSTATWQYKTPNTTSFTVGASYGFFLKGWNDHNLKIRG